MGGHLWKRKSILLPFLLLVVVIIYFYILHSILLGGADQGKGKEEKREEIRLGGEGTERKVKKEVKEGEEKEDEEKEDEAKEVVVREKAKEEEGGGVEPHLYRFVRPSLLHDDYEIFADILPTPTNNSDTHALRQPNSDSNQQQRRTIAVSLLVGNLPHLLQSMLPSLINCDIRNHEIIFLVWFNFPNITGAVEAFTKPTIPHPWRLVLMRDKSLSNRYVIIPRTRIWEEVLEFRRATKQEVHYLFEIHDDMLYPHFWLDNLLTAERDVACTRGKGCGMIMPWTITEPMSDRALKDPDAFVRSRSKRYNSSSVMTDCVQNQVQFPSSPLYSSFFFFFNSRT